MNAVALKVASLLLSAIPEEMGLALMRSAHSPNIKERRDFSCALTGRGGRLVAQASHIPVHLGATHECAARILEELDLEPGDVVVVNDPWAGGTHLPDVTLFSLVRVAEGFDLGVMVRAHHADVGGAWPGSMGPARDVHAEGLVIPPVRLVRGGRLQEDVLRLILANTRTPDERRADLRAQLAALELGRTRVEALAERRGAEGLRTAEEALHQHAARAARALIRALPTGRRTARLPLDAPEGPHIAVALERVDDELVCDFEGTSPAVQGPWNANRAIATSAVFYAIRCLLGADLPTNSGVLEPVRILIPAGSLLDPPRPSAVCMGNVETSQRITDVVLAALAEALPDRIPAASQGTMNNLAVGGRGRDGRWFTFYETLAGGCGGGPERPGASGLHSHMTNTLNTPVEALELAFPVRVRRYELRRGSGGAGERPGGEGVVREIEALVPLRATVTATRRVTGAPGAAGGEEGRPGRDVMMRADGTTVPLPVEGVWLEPGEAVRVETPGGGGHGRPPEEGPA